MIRRIDHIAIAVRDLDRAKAFFLDGLGGRELCSQPYPQQKFRWTTIELGTSCFIELINPLEKDGFLHRFLASRGEGLHHITIQVEDIQETRKTLEKRGIPTMGPSESLPGWKEMFIHPRDAFGTLIQLAEFNPLDWINPGCLPPSHQEFLPSQEIESGVEVRTIETEKGLKIEIKRGKEKIRIPQSQLGDLIQALKQVRGKPVSSK